MKITAKHGRGKKIHLSLDGEYCLTTTEDFWYARSLPDGTEVTPEEWAALEQEIQFHKALEKAYGFLSRRDHSRQELVEKLCRTTGREAAEQAADAMAQRGYLDDLAYARAAAREWMRVKQFSLRRVEQELFRRGIDRELVQQVLEEIEVDPREQLRTIVERKYRRALTDEKGRRRTIAALQRLGYSYGDIQCVLREFIEIEENEE